MESYIKKICTIICSILDSSKIKSGIKHIEAQAPHKTKADIVEQALDFCKKHSGDVHWGMYLFAEEEAKIICKCKAPKNASKCVEYVKDQILKNDLYALKRYDPTKKAKKRTFITMLVTSRITDFLRREVGKTIVSYDDEMHNEKDDPLDKEIQQELLEFIEEAFGILVNKGKLSPQEQFVYQALFKRELSYEEIESELQMDRKKIYPLREALIRKLKKYSVW